MARQSPIKNLVRKTPRCRWWEVGFGTLPFATGELQFEHLEKYIRAAENVVGSERNDLKQKIQQRVASTRLTPDEIEDYAQGLYDYHQEDFWIIEDRFPWLIYSGSLIIACLLFESSLVDVCISFDKDSALNKKQGWSKSGEYARAYSVLKEADHFLSTNFGLECSTHPHWSKISDYYRIRNCIAHANGDASRMKHKHEYPKIVSRYSHGCGRPCTTFLRRHVRI